MQMFSSRLGCTRVLVEDAEAVINFCKHRKGACEEDTIAAPVLKEAKDLVYRCRN